MAVLWNSTSEVTRLINTPRSLHEDLLEGLQQTPRRIPSKYFYDDRGSEIFERITELSEYYPTRCEAEILRSQSEKIIQSLNLPKHQRVNIVELGAGDGRKTSSLLEAGQAYFNHMIYHPVDISSRSLIELQQRLMIDQPALICEPCELDMEVDYDELPIDEEATNIILYLGSSIGNFDPVEQKSFLKKISKNLNAGDFFFIGFDLKKDPQVLQMAYDDPQGVTREFNMNLLQRLNNELDADFELSQFRHLALYNPHVGAMESWLVSLKDQVIQMKEIDFELRLKSYESIHVETSWKFSEAEVDFLASVCGFQSVNHFFDSKKWFMNTLWKK